MFDKTEFKNQWFRKKAALSLDQGRMCVLKGFFGGEKILMHLKN